VKLVRRYGAKGDITQRRIFCGQELAKEDPPEEAGGMDKNDHTSPQNCPDGMDKNVHHTTKSNINNKPPIIPHEIFSLCAAYAGGDGELLEAVLGLLENRAALRKSVKTTRAMNGILRQLDKHSGGDRAVKLLLLEKATMLNFMFEETGTDTSPVDCFEIARKLYYILRPYPQLEFSAYLEAISESNEGYSKVEQDPITGMCYYVIYYNDQDHGIRNIRWMVFHEISHIYLGHHDNPPGNEQMEEDGSDFFAKYAMCPPPLLNGTKCTCALDVYNKFDASDGFSGYASNYFQRWLYF